ncbi:CHASE domain-containing protein [Nitrosopumilus sp. S6]
MQEKEFEFVTKNIANNILEKLNIHEQVLMGFHGLFATSEIVESHEFYNFYNLQNIEKRFPDNQGIGYIEYISSEERKNEINIKLKESEFQGIYPEEQRDKYFPVVLLMPDNERNRKAIGFDIYSEQIRSEAVDRAMKTGKTVLTGKITLVQETDVDIQNGFLIIMPIYDFHDKQSSNYGEFFGFVYSVFRMNDFMTGTLEDDIFEHIEIKIFDGSHVSEKLFFDSNKIKVLQKEKEFSKNEEIVFGGGKWIIQFEGIPEHQGEQNTMIEIPIIGYSMSGLLFYVFLLFSKNIQLSQIMMKKEKIALVGELTSRLSHDIRNPLSNIKMSVELLTRERELSMKKNIHEKLQTISKNVDRISHQVDDVLDFIRIGKIHKEKISIKSCINESIESVKIPKNIKLGVNGQDAILLGDPYQIQVVFRNLMVNAIQAIGNEKGNIIITLDNKPDFIKITFEDSANILQDSQVSMIFEPLTTTKQTGTGLGLVSCKQIIENHGGKISAQTHPTRFNIILPKK